MLAVSPLLLGVASCSSSNNNQANAGSTTGTTAAKTAAAVSSSGVAVTPGPPPPGATPGAMPTITQVMTDNAYSVTNMVIPAGQPVTVIVQNKGAIHNWHVLGVTADNGAVIMSPLQQGPRTDNITFTLSKTGTYAFQCDAHPTEMKGTLTVR
jgi:plastocyanin